MQITHYCNGIGLPDYPSELAVSSVNVYMHDSGMICTHDYSCPTCRKDKAVLHLSTGIMQPCWSCQKLGYKIVKSKPKNKIMKFLGL